MGFEIGKYKLSPDFEKKSEGEFINELRKSFKVTKKEAKEVYDKLHGNSSGRTKKDKPVDKKGNAGDAGVPGAEEAEGNTSGHTEDKAQ